jgi:hypothetical protein
MWWMVCAALATGPAAETPTSEPTVEAVTVQDLSGTWVLDLGASDDIDALLKAQGFSGMQRSFVKRMGVTQRIVDERDTLKLQVETSVANDSQVLLADGVARDHTSRQGLTSKVSHVREADGTWVTTSVGQDEKGNELVLVSRRFLEGGAMVLQIRMTHAGEVHELRRVFRRG